MSEIPESDWKVFKELRPLALERLGRRLLDEILHVTSESNKSAVERFHDIAAKVKEGREELQIGFDRFSRSWCMNHLIFMHTRGLLREEEKRRFSDATRERLKMILGE